jgi:cellulose synthase/poly-beta-1,6-N-acetylglucosamine synthase-like glycosyltransferase
VIHALNVANEVFFVYFFVCNLFYLAALIIAFWTSAAHQHRLQSIRLAWMNDSPLTPPITVVAPAHNEEKSIRIAVRSLLELDYPALELIVVNDGSVDRTMQELHEEFRLRPVRMVYVS